MSVWVAAAEVSTAEAGMVLVIVVKALEEMLESLLE